jgi:hypothetical protein
MFHIEFNPNWVENIDIMIIISFTAVVKYGFTVPIFTKLTVSHCIALNFTHIGQEIHKYGQKFIYTLKYGCLWANFHETSTCILTVCK